MTKTKAVPHVLRLIDAIRTISRSAHQWRDRAAARYEAAHFKAATTARKRKEYCYNLKERGIVAAHRGGLLRYAGQSPQGMAVYSYGAHDRACFHSCLHPRGVERALIVDHPEILLVPTRRLQQRICDAVFTLAALPEPGADYERSAAPRIKRPPIICWECGKEGHIARNCPEHEDYEFEDESEAWAVSSQKNIAL